MTNYYDDYYTGEILSKPSKSGKRKLFYAEINGRRTSKTLFARKWEARNEMNHYLKILKKQRAERLRKGAL